MLPPTRVLLNPNVLYAVSHSGGKDSQAQLIEVLKHVPAAQVAVFHADLGDIEWPGAKDLAQKQAEDAGVPFIVAHAVYKDGSPKSFLNKVEHQFARRPDAPSFPSKNARWCTGELKTQPIDREIRRYATAKGFTTVVSCIGLRAAESDDRKAKAPWSHDAKKSIQARPWFEWLPIHELQTLDVWCVIRGAGQWPHEAYNGNERLSCLFCIYGSKRDLAHAARKHPDVFQRYVEAEARTGYFLHMDRKPLAKLVAEAASLGA